MFGVLYQPVTVTPSTRTLICCTFTLTVRKSLCVVNKKLDVSGGSRISAAYQRYTDLMKSDTGQRQLLLLKQGEFQARLGRFLVNGIHTLLDTLTIYFKNHYSRIRFSQKSGLFFDFLKLLKYNIFLSLFICQTMR